MRTARWIISLWIASATAIWLWRPAAFIADDSYFYAVIARNIARGAGQTFSGVFPTNGAHPLWLYLMAGWATILEALHAPWLDRLEFAVLPAAALMALGAVALVRLSQRWKLDATLAVLPSVVFLSAFGVLYSEAHAHFAALSLLAVLVARDAHPAVLGLATAALVLARLDSVFLVPFLVAWWVARGASLRFLAGFGIAAGIPLSLYAISNLWFFGGLVPISGHLKSTFPVLAWRGLERAGLWNWTLSGYSVPFGWLPLALSLVLLVALRIRFRSERGLLWVLAFGIAGQAIWVASFTSGKTGWHWYYVEPISILALTLATAAERWRLTSRTRASAALAVLVAGVAVLAMTRWGPTREFDWQIRALREAGAAGSVVLVADYPGVLAWRDEQRVIAADLLTANRRIYSRLTAQPNGLAALLDECARAGAPVEFISLYGGDFLGRDPTKDELVYYDPRSLSQLREIGRMPLPPAAAESSLGWRLYRLTDQNPSRAPLE